MSKTTKTTDAIAQAVAERHAAEKRYQDAVAVADAKRSEAQALHQRSAEGDDTVTGLDLVAVDADVTRLDGRARAAEEMLSGAREAEKVATTAAIADKIAAAFDHNALDQAEADAIEVIAGVLTKLSDQRTSANVALRQGIWDAVAAGLDFQSPGRVRLGHDGFPGPVARAKRLVVDGKRVDAVDPGRTLLDVLAEAMDQAGYRLVVRDGTVAVAA